MEEKARVSKSDARAQQRAQAAARRAAKAKRAAAAVNRTTFDDTTSSTCTVPAVMTEIPVGSATATGTTAIGPHTSGADSLPNLVTELEHQSSLVTAIVSRLTSAPWSEDTDESTSMSNDDATGNHHPVSLQGNSGGVAVASPTSKLVSRSSVIEHVDC